MRDDTCDWCGQRHAPDHVWVGAWRQTYDLTRRTLSDVMEFDHPIQVHADGTVTDGPAGVYAPDLYDEELSDEAWEFASHGYTGQHGYRGPILHNSEYIGGGLERDILATPGVYAAVAAYWSPELPEVPEDWPVRELDDDDPAEWRATCGECGRSWDDAEVTSMTPTPAARCPFEAFHAPEGSEVEGWAVVRLRDTGDEG
jgi:hypothetical protein